MSGEKTTTTTTILQVPSEDPKIAALKEEVYYHGLLPREDLVSLLYNDGDFIVRCSEVENRKEIILSVNVGDQDIPPAGDPAANAMSVMCAPTGENKPNKIRNFVVQWRHGNYQLDKDRPFPSVQQLIEFHLNNTVTVNKVQLQLRTPVRLAKWEFRHCDVTVLKKLGAGEFGEVRAGQLKRKGKTVNVAIKLTKGTSELSKAKIKLMMKEARVMRDFRHNNVVRMYGVAVTEQPLMILLELVSGGSLDSYLTKNQVGMYEKIKMCQGAATGVEYLHKLRCIHRDLAARNCLYANTKVVKISDFGLSRIGSSYTLKTVAKVPIKWCAPESILTFTFTAKTDVWSYGVMCYEIMFDGLSPHEGKTNTEVKRELLAGQTLDFKDNVPAAFRQFWKERVWAFKEEQRASMAEIVTFFLDKSDGMTPEPEQQEGGRKERTVDEERNGSDSDSSDKSKMQSKAQDVVCGGDKPSEKQEKQPTRRIDVDDKAHNNMSTKEYNRKKMKLQELQKELGIEPGEQQQTPTVDGGGGAGTSEKKEKESKHSQKKKKGRRVKTKSGQKEKEGTIRTKKSRIQKTKK